MDRFNFSFLFDTEIVFGPGAENEAGALVKKYSGSKAMIVYGSGSIKASGLYGRIADSLRAAGVGFTDFGGVQPNPRRTFAEEGTRRALEEGVDFLLAVGGGSSIDTAKAIAIGAANGGDFWQFFLGKTPEAALPVGTVHTIAASGSETSRSCVLVDDMDTGQKKGLWSRFRPVFAAMDPELTYTLPQYQTAAGCVDAFSHTFMRYFSNSPCELACGFGEATMRAVVRYAPIAVSEPENYEARAEIMLAASLSHCDLMMIGRCPGGAGGEHALESQLSGYYDTTHGAGLAVMMPALLNYFIKHGSPGQVALAARFAENVFSVDREAGDEPARARLGAAAFTEWLAGLGMPTTLSALGVPEAEVRDAVERCMRARGSTIDGFLELDEAAVTEIYLSAI